MVKHGIEYSGGEGIGNGLVPILDRLIDILLRMGWDKNLLNVSLDKEASWLKFELGARTNEMMAAVDDAAVLCSMTCEDCGDSGEERRRSGMPTLCDECDEYAQAGAGMALGFCA